MAYTTRHGRRRMYQRAGITRGSANKMAKRILEKGFRHTDTTGELNRFLCAQWKKHHNSNNMRVYGNQLYIFCNDSLITVIVLPEQIMQDMKGNLTEQAYQRYVGRRRNKGKAA